MGTKSKIRGQAVVEVSRWKGRDANHGWSRLGTDFTRQTMTWSDRVEAGFLCRQEAVLRSFGVV